MVGIIGTSQGISASSVGGVAVSERSVCAMDVDVTGGRPFAMVDEISEASPAAEDGLQLGDQIVKFGTVEFGDALLPKLAAEAQANRGHAVPVVVKRQGALINLSVTPREWQGRGLLGYVLLQMIQLLSLLFEILFCWSPNVGQGTLCEVLCKFEPLAVSLTEWCPLTHTYIRVKVRKLVNRKQFEHIGNLMNY